MNQPNKMGDKDIELGKVFSPVVLRERLCGLMCQRQPGCCGGTEEQLVQQAVEYSVTEHSVTQIDRILNNKSGKTGQINPVNKCVVVLSSAPTPHELWIVDFALYMCVCMHACLFVLLCVCVGAHVCGA